MEVNCSDSVTYTTNTGSFQVTCDSDTHFTYETEPRCTGIKYKRTQKLHSITNHDNITTHFISNRITPGTEPSCQPVHSLQDLWEFQACDVGAGWADVGAGWADVGAEWAALAPTLLE